MGSLILEETQLPYLACNVLLIFDNISKLPLTTDEHYIMEHLKNGALEEALPLQAVSNFLELEPLHCLPATIEISRNMSVLYLVGERERERVLSR